MWQYELFEKDISILSYRELAEWIICCRQFISKSIYDSVEEYQYAVDDFCMEWEKHYNQNEQIYKSENFEKAILFIGRKDKLRFKVDFGKGKEDITESILTNTMSVVFVEKAKKIADDKFDEDIKKVDEDLKQCFKNKEEFKNNINSQITEFYFNKINSRIRVFKDNKMVRASSYKELLEQCENLKNYEIKAEGRTSSSSYLNALEKFDIPKTNYTDYMSVVKAEKAYDKKFFINLAFALSLPYNYAENLLYFNGFSILDSVKMFDIICEKAFRIGFGREYVIALIDKYNSDMKKKYPKFAEVQNITKTKKKKSGK